MKGVEGMGGLDDLASAVSTRPATKAGTKPAIKPSLAAAVWILALVASAFVVVLILARLTSNKRGIDYNGIPLWTADSIIFSYEQNEVRADGNLKGKWARVEGRVHHVGKDLLGSPYVLINTEHIIRKVQCSMRDAAGLEQLSPGDYVIIAGRGDGLMGHAQFKDCRLLQLGKETKEIP